MQRIEETVENLRNIEYPDNAKELDKKFKDAIVTTYKAINELTDLIDSSIRLNDGYVSYEYIRNSFFDVYKKIGITHMLGQELTSKIFENPETNDVYILMVRDNFQSQFDAFEEAVYYIFDRVSYIIALPVNKDGMVHIDNNIKLIIDHPYR